MGRFITGRAEIRQDVKTSKWLTLHNQLFIDNYGLIYLVPRNTITDGYTFPMGGKMASFPVEPAIGHDFECIYKKAIIVNISINQLIEEGYIRAKEIYDKGNYRTIKICENIPGRYLTIKETTFKQTNDRFLRMMKAVGVSKFWAFGMHKAVFLNYSWFLRKSNPINFENLYNMRHGDSCKK